MIGNAVAIAAKPRGTQAAAATDAAVTSNARRAESVAIVDGELERHVERGRNVVAQHRADGAQVGRNLDRLCRTSTLSVFQVLGDRFHPASQLIGDGGKTLRAEELLETVIAIVVIGDE